MLPIVPGYGWGARSANSHLYRGVGQPTAREGLCRDLQHVEIALDDLGLNLGAITHQKKMPGINPLGFGDLDIDKVGHGCDLSTFTFKVSRKGDPELGHYWFRVPNPAKPIDTTLHGTRRLHMEHGPTRFDPQGREPL